MNKATVREFTRNPYKYLKDLPLYITKNGDPVYQILPFDQKALDIISRRNLKKLEDEKPNSEKNIKNIKNNKNDKNDKNDKKDLVFNVRPKFADEGNGLDLCKLCGTMRYKHITRTWEGVCEGRF